MASLAGYRALEKRLIALKKELPDGFGCILIGNRRGRLRLPESVEEGWI
jgi:hypothetical protein